MVECLSMSVAVTTAVTAAAVAAVSSLPLHLKRIVMEEPGNKMFFCISTLFHITTITWHSITLFIFFTSRSTSTWKVVKIISPNPYLSYNTWPCSVVLGWFEYNVRMHDVVEMRFAKSRIFWINTSEYLRIWECQKWIIFYFTPDMKYIQAWFDQNHLFGLCLNWRCIVGFHKDMERW